MAQRIGGGAEMPRYFFDIVIGARRIPDQDGQELPGSKAARDRAYAEIRSLLSNRMVDMLHADDCHIEINDEARRFLFKVDLSEAYERSGHLRCI
jgi:hypothetical protein